MVNMVYNTSLLLTVSWVHLLTPSSQHASVSPSAAYRAVRNSAQSVDSSPPMKRQRSLKVELVVSSPCHQIRGPRAAGDGARFTFLTTRRATGPTSGKLSTPYALQASLCRKQ